jgi:hypothetical protein
VGAELRPRSHLAQALATGALSRNAAEANRRKRSKQRGRKALRGPRTVCVVASLFDERPQTGKSTIGFRFQASVFSVISCSTPWTPSRVVEPFSRAPRVAILVSRPGPISGAEGQGQRVLIDLFQVAVLVVAVNREPSFADPIAQLHNVFPSRWLAFAPFRGREACCTYPVRCQQTPATERKPHHPTATSWPAQAGPLFGTAIRDLGKRRLRLKLASWSQLKRLSRSCWPCH